MFLLFSFCFAVILVFSLHICFSHGFACVPQAASLIGIAKIGAVFPGLGDETLLLDGTSFWNAWARILRMMLYCCHLWHCLLGSLADDKLFWGAGLEISQFKPLKLHSSSPCVDLRSHKSVQGEKAVLGGTFFVQVGGQSLKQADFWMRK